MLKYLKTTLKCSIFILFQLLSALPHHCPSHLLQSFLKELPGSLLVSELYNSWMMALDNEDTQQRALEIRK